MSDNLNKEQQEAFTETAAETPSLEEQDVLEGLTEVPIQTAEQILVGSVNEDSTNNTNNEEEEEEEQNDRVQDTPNNINSLDSFLELTNVPKTEEEFYRASFDIFKRINDYYNSLKSHVLSETAVEEIQSMAFDYTDALNGYQEYCQDEQAQAKQELHSIVKVWELAVKLHISAEKSSKDNVYSLVDWLNIFYPIEANEDIPDWDALYRHILRANMDDAIDLLTSFPLDQAKLVKPLRTLLEEYKNVQEQADLDDWKHKCASQFESIQSTAQTEFTHIYLLLMGVSDSIRITGTFFDQLVGLIRYGELYASRKEITALAESLHPTQINDTHSAACAALLLGRIDDALEHCDNYWMQTHLGHLLIILGIRQQPSTSVDSSFDAEVIVDPIYQMTNAYAQTIAEKYNMWTEAVVYISICVPNRVVWIRILLDQERAKDISLLKSVLETVDKCAINQVKPYIHKSIGQLYEKNNDVYNATIEYGKAQDINSLDRIGTDLFIKCLETGKLQDKVVSFQDVRSSPIYDCVAKYNDLRKNLSSKQYKEASRIVLDIFTSNTLPDKFKPIIFIDADAILSTKESYYNQNELVTLLDTFQSLLDALSNQSYFAQYYQHALGTKCTSDTIIAMLREKMAYKAIIA